MSFSERVQAQMAQNSTRIREENRQKWRAEISAARARSKALWEERAPYLRDLLAVVDEQFADLGADLRCRNAVVLLAAEESRADRVLASIVYEELEDEARAAREREYKTARDLFLAIDQVCSCLVELGVEDQRLDRALLLITRLKLAGDSVTNGGRAELAEAMGKMIKDGLINSPSLARSLVTPVRKP